MSDQERGNLLSLDPIGRPPSRRVGQRAVVGHNTRLDVTPSRSPFTWLNIHIGELTVHFRSRVDAERLQRALDRALREQ